MKPNEKRLIIILVAITLIVLGVSMLIKNNNKQEEQTNQNSQIIEQNGVKQNTSNKLKEAKKIDDLDITNIQITEENGEATITANIQNNTMQERKEFPMTIKVMNNKGEVIQEVGAYVGKMKVGETRGINASVNMNITDIYDINFQK